MDKIYKSLSDKHRRAILTMLKDKEMNVNQMLGYFNIGQATLSTHLSVLRKAGLVSCRVFGKQRIYSVQNSAVLNLLKDIENMLFVAKVSDVGEIILRRKTV